jgi:ketosteroid isomerase-like protein|tara:strand:- start:533 stop:1027 length:495 start_codon:yes stop_codon:yes gene_type:complete
MKKFIIAFSFLIISPLWADGHLSSEKEVMQLVLGHWEARDNNDYKAQADLMSPSGTYNANSDGSFFRFSNNNTAEDIENNMGDQKSSLDVKYPETIALSDNVILARYYLEGVISDQSGTVNNYRTRVTHIWVKEKAGWKTKSWHFSPLHDGGRHVTSASDFEED